MKEQGIERYVDAIFAYCLKRLNNVEDARDLAQEILCEALASLHCQQVENFESWIWTVAHNRYYHLINSRRPTTLSLDVERLADKLADSTEPEWDEEIQAAFAALHTLAASHREIMVDFYVKGLSCDEIAQKHHLPPKTVRTRLFYGRDRLRRRWQIKMSENRIYTQQRWMLTRNGSVDPSMLDRQVVRGILAACYQKFQTVDELSLATGIPALYIEDELPRMARAELIEWKGDKYRAAFIIYSPAFTAGAERFLLSCVRPTADLVVELLTAYTPPIRQLGFYGSDFPSTRLWWSLIPRLIREASLQVRRGIPSLRPMPRPLRRDGTRGWLCAYSAEDPAFQHKQYADPERNFYRYYWSEEMYSSLTVFSVIARLEALQVRGPEVDINDELLLADCIRCDLIKRSPDGMRWNIPVLSARQDAALHERLSQAAEPLAQALLPIAEKLYEMMRADVPQHLHDQINGVFPMELHSLIQMVSAELIRRRLLQAPPLDHFAGQAMMICGEKTVFRV